MNDPLLAAVALGDEIQRFGSYFGYAAIIGLGVLSLLYFAQAREVKRLRDWAGRAPERDAELAQRVQSDAQRRVVAQPIATPSSAAAQPAGPQTPAAQSADAARKAAAAAVMEKFQAPGTAPAAGTAAAAGAAATPASSPTSPSNPSTVGPPGSLTRAAPAGATGSAAEAASAAGATPAADPSATPAAPDASAPASASGSVEAANAPAGGTAGPASGAASTPASDKPSTSLPPGMSAGTAGALAAARQAAASAPSSAYANGAGGQDTHESDAARPEPLPDLPIRRPRAAPTDDRDPAASRGRIGAIIAGSVAVLVAGVVLVLVLTGGSDTPPANNEIGDATPPAATPPPPPAPPALTRADKAATPVTVLNGTTQTGLASAVARTIEKDGFTILATETNADQQIAKTTVSYAAGNERAARAVAQIMKVPTSAVRAIDANTSVAASPESKIVVIVGSDKSGAG